VTRTRRRAPPPGPCRPAGRGPASRDRAACTPPRCRACTAPMSRNCALQRSSGRRVSRGHSLRRQDRATGAVRHRGDHAGWCRLLPIFWVHS
jgi:hypothetical protein